VSANDDCHCAGTTKVAVKVIGRNASRWKPWGNHRKQITLDYIRRTLNLEWNMPKHFSHFTDTLKFTVKINYGKDAKKRWDFSLVFFLKVCRESDDMLGKTISLQLSTEAATGKARSPTVDSRVRRTFSRMYSVQLASQIILLGEQWLLLLPCSRAYD